MVVEFIRSAYANRTRPDLIVAVGGPASAFARRNRSQLFPDVPLLFVAVDQRYLGSEPLGENEAAAAVINDFPRVIDNILQLLAPDETGVRGERGRPARPILAS